MRAIILILLFSIIAYSQTEVGTVKISADSLFEKSISLNIPWKYAAGDDSSWADQSFNDTEWDTLIPRLAWDNYDNTKWNGIGWFRLNIQIDSSLLNKSVALSVNHFGASEIYLNGELIRKFGTFSVNPDSEKVYQPNGIPIALNFGDNLNNLLAVRYSNHDSAIDPEWTDSWYGHHGFVMRINEINSRILEIDQDGKLNFGINFGIGGIFFSLSVLYFLLHLFYSKRRENLYYALFSLSLALIFTSSVATRLISQYFTVIIIIRVLGILGIGLTFLSYLGFIYSIFYKKIPKQIWLFVAGTIVMGILLFITPVMELFNYILPIYIFLATMEGFRAIIMAIKKNKEHSWVIGIGVIVFVIMVLAIFIISLFQLNPPPILILIIFLVGLFGLPASMSVYLARSIASTNEKLEQQVIEIKDLSAKELVAEQTNAKLLIETEREKSAKNEAILQAKAAELQAKASEAERRTLELENHRKSKELEEARNLQLSLLPKTIPNIPGLDIAVHMETATEVGGDYYDFHEAPDGELTILIGDATGHGLNAGTMVTATKSLFNSYAGNPNIIETFQKISYSLRHMNFKFLSMCLMLLKIKDGKIRISSAGMPPALIYKNKSKEIEEVLIKGMPLGTAKVFPYEEREIKIESGDTLLLMSDGFPELFDKSKQMFGYKNVQVEFKKYGDKSPDLIISELKRCITNWAGDSPPNDDVTFVAIKVG